MNKKKLIFIALFIILIAFFVLFVPGSKNVSSADDAIKRVQKMESSLRDYPSDNLPPKRIAQEEIKDGWLLGFYMEGSGLPGILAASCYRVMNDGTITSTGFFSANGQPGPQALDLVTCAPRVAENPEGEADPSRMNLEMKTWNWVSALYNDGRSITPKKDLFSLTFKEGKFTARTDCNSMSGSYTASDGVISFSSIAMTKMYCEGSQENEFAKLLENSSGYHFTGKGELILDLKFDSGTATFR